MKCQFCQAELEEGTSVCPNCGEVLTQPKKKSAIAPILAIALCAVVLVAMVIVVVMGINGSTAPQETDPIETTTPVETTAAPYDASAYLVNVDFANRASYSLDADALNAVAKDVAVTAGDAELTNQDLQIYYQMQVGDFMSYYGYYAYYYFGLDEKLPLDTQYLPNSQVTWEQYFLDNAVNTWRQNTALCRTAKAENHQLPQEMQESLDQLPAELQAEADSAGYASLDEMITDQMGQGCTMDAYLRYVETYYYAVSYYETLYNAIEPTEDEIKAYFDGHVEVFAEQGITAESAPITNVRHILLMPQGGTADASGNVTYSEAEWEACYNSAQAVLDTWKAGEATEESFAELVNEHSADGGSNTTGGLYEGVTDDGTYVPEFTAWAVDASRQTGDTGIVRTDYGYHIMYYVSGEAAWHLYAKETLVTEQINGQVAQLEEAYPMTCHFDRMAVCKTGQEATAETTAPTE